MICHERETLIQLRALIEGQEFLIETVARYSYGRSVANVKVGGKSVNGMTRRKLED